LHRLLEDHARHFTCSDHQQPFRVPPPHELGEIACQIAPQRDQYGRKSPVVDDQTSGDALIAPHGQETQRCGEQRRDRHGREHAVKEVDPGATGIPVIEPEEEQRHDGRQYMDDHLAPVQAERAQVQWRRNGHPGTQLIGQIVGQSCHDQVNNEDQYAQPQAGSSTHRSLKLRPRDARVRGAGGLSVSPWHAAAPRRHPRPS